MDKSIKASPKNLFVLPSVVIVAVVTQLLFLITIVLSFFQWNLMRPNSFGFTGLQNFIRVFKSGDFYTALFNLLSMSLLSLLFCAVLGMCFALLLNRRFFGVNVIRTLFIMPLFVMDAVIGIIWRTLILNPSFGINAIISRFIGISPIEFFSDYPFQTIIALVVWQWAPFFVLVFLAGLQSIPNEIEDSAKIDGASALRKFISIDLPIMRNHIQVALMLGLVFILKVFGTIYVTTNGGPGSATTTLPFYTYRIGFLSWDAGLAAAVAVVTVVVSLILLLVMFKLLQGRKEE